MTNAIHSGHVMGAPYRSTSNATVEDKAEGDASIARDIIDYFNNLNMSNNIDHLAEQDQKTMVESEKVTHSTDYSVQLFCINSHAQIEKSSQTLSSEEHHVASSCMPFICTWNYIYDVDSNTRISRLPLPIKSYPDYENSVIYNFERQTLILFLYNYIPCFYRLNDKQDELRVDAFMELQSDMVGTLTYLCLVTSNNPVRKQE